MLKVVGRTVGGIAGMSQLPPGVLPYFFWLRASSSATCSGVIPARTTSLASLRIWTSVRAMSSSERPSARMAHSSRSMSSIPPAGGRLHFAE
jgi:hypothetical protein